MQGIIGAFLGFLISFLASILLLNQPGAFQKVPDLLKQPIYSVFVIVGTFAGMLVGYLCRTTHFDNEYPKKDTAVVYPFNDALADTIVTVACIFFGVIVHPLDHCCHYIFIFLVLLLWFLFRKGVFPRKNSQSGQEKAKLAEMAEKK